LTILLDRKRIVVHAKIMSERGKYSSEKKECEEKIKSESRNSVGLRGGGKDTENCRTFIEITG